jgi:hypothetical protein
MQTAAALYVRDVELSIPTPPPLHSQLLIRARLSLRRDATSSHRAMHSHLSIHTAPCTPLPSQIRDIEPSSLSGGLGLIASALCVRLLVTRAALAHSGLNAKEAALVCVAWVPKATVQAAVGGAALDLMVEQGHGADAEVAWLDVTWFGLA